MKKAMLAVILVLSCGICSAQTVTVPIEDYLAPIRQELAQAKKDMATLTVLVESKREAIEKAQQKLDAIVVDESPMVDEFIYSN